MKLWIVCREVVNLGGVDGLQSEEKEERTGPDPGEQPTWSTLERLSRLERGLNADR